MQYCRDENAIKDLIVRFKMHIDELEIAHRYTEAEAWKETLQDVRDLGNRVDSIRLS